MSIQVLSLAAAMAESAKADLLTSTTTTTTTLPSTTNRPKQCSVGGVDRIVLPTPGRTGTLLSYKTKKNDPMATSSTVLTGNKIDNNLFDYPTSRTSLGPVSTRNADGNSNSNRNLTSNPAREMSGIVSHLRNAAHPSPNRSRSLYSSNDHGLDSLVRAKAASSLLSAALSQQQQQQHHHHHSNAMSLHALQRAYGMKWTSGAGTGTGTGTGYPSHSQIHKACLEQHRDYCSSSPSCSSSLHAAVASLFLPPRTQVQTLPSPLLMAAASLAVRNRYHLGSALSETDARTSPPPTSTSMPPSRSPRIWDKNATADRSPRSPAGDSNLAPAAAASAFSSSSFAKHRPKVLFMECDEESLSEYQCLIRQQMELFEATADHATSNVQGRNKQILVGQVGIRCRHCCSGPATDANGGDNHNNNHNHHHRSKGNMYFPTKLDRVYQAAQNLSAFHLCGPCSRIPPDIRKRIQLLRERKSPAGGGKRYWAESVRCLGVVEAKDGTGLRFA